MLRVGSSSKRGIGRYRIGGGGRACYDTNFGIRIHRLPRTVEKGEKMKTRSLLYITILSVLLILWGCGSGTFRMYSGPRLPKSQVAFLKWDSAINVILVDGKLVPRCSRIELFPGDHDVQVGYSNSGFRSRRDRLIRFTAEGGHKYRIRHTIDSSSELIHWNAWIEDVTNMEDQNQPS